MPKNSFLQAIFKGPKFSIAPIEQNNRGSCKIGKVFPVFSTVLNPREGVQLDMAHLLRMLPMQAPTMEGYKVTFDAFAVPFSCLGYAERRERDLDDFFNLKQNGGEVQNPFSHPFSELMRDDDGLSFVYKCGSQNGKFTDLFRLHSLGDYINFPSLKSVRDHVRKWLQVNPFAYGSNLEMYFSAGSSGFSSSVIDAARFAALALINNKKSIDDNLFEIDLYGLPDVVNPSTLLGIPFSVKENPLVTTAHVNDDDLFASSVDDGEFGFSGVSVLSLVGYILENYPAVAAYYHYSDLAFGGTSAQFQTSVIVWVGRLAGLISDNNPISLDYLRVLYDNYKIDAQSIWQEYFEYCMSVLLYNPSIINNEQNTLYDIDGDVAEGAFLPYLPDSEPIDLSYFAAYWKIISDWYINTNIDGDPETFFLQHCKLLSPFNGSDDDQASYLLDLEPFSRRWSNDIFTSAVPMAQVQNVRIPADGTIPDLREANAYQKLVDIFRNTGNRLRDVVYGIFGITPSAVRSEMSEPIGSLSSWVGVQSVLQTSQTTESSALASYSGIGTDSQGHKRILKYVNNAEPTPVIIMVLMSVTQRASYMQGFDKKFFRSSIYDFAIPELAMVGEEEVTNKEVYFDKGYQGGVFGFNRRYYSWFFSGSEVHGDLRDTLDFWHTARIFDEQPLLNPEFIGIESDIDHLQRHFANVSEAAAPFIFNLSFDGYKTVALPRYIQYEL